VGNILTSWATVSFLKTTYSVELVRTRRSNCFFTPLGPRMVFPLDPRAKKPLLELFLKTNSYFLALTIAYLFTNDKLLYSTCTYYTFAPATAWSWDSSISTVSDYRLDDDDDDGFDPWQRHRMFPLASVSRPTLRSTQPPIQWVPEVLSPGVERGRGVTLTTHPHQVPRSRMSRSYTLPVVACMVVTGQLCLSCNSLYLTIFAWKTYILRYGFTVSK
jgi:hypothetical protein